MNSPQPTPRSGGYSQRPEVFSEVQVPLKPMLWAGRYTPDSTRGTAGDAHFSLKTCVAIRLIESNSILATGLIAGAEVRHTETWLRAGPTWGYCAGSYTPDFTKVIAGDAHFSPKTCVATRFKSNCLLATGLIAGAEVRHTDTWLRADPSCRRRARRGTNRYRDTRGVPYAILT